MSDAKSCAVCGVGPHRYGTSDPHHKYNAMGCVNSLRFELERAEAERDAALARLAEAEELLRLAEVSDQIGTRERGNLRADIRAFLARSEEVQ